MHPTSTGPPAVLPYASFAERRETMSHVAPRRMRELEQRSSRDPPIVDEAV